MVWFTIALMVASFVLTQLLTPRPKLEDARAGSLDDIDFPRATENAPVPLVLGKVRVKSANTLWYGNFSTVPQTKKVKTGLFFSKTQTTGYQYFLSLDLALALGEGVQLREIHIDDTTVWSGTSSASAEATGSITAASIFGGPLNGGGWSGDFTYYPGSLTQTVNSHVEGIVGSGDVPAYRAISHIVFENNYIGEAPNLRKMAFVVQKYTDDLSITGSGMVGDDMNPMEALYQILTDEYLGMGVAVSKIDTVAMAAAGETLYTEGNGVSVLVSSASEGKSLIEEILRQVDGMMYQDPETGKLVVKLIRDDYTASTLPIFDESDIIMVNQFNKTSWDEVVTQVKVTYSRRDRDSSSVAISQDQATANMLGRMNTATMSFPFCYDADTANKIAHRERAQQSVPLFQMSIEMNRAGYTLRPGDAFKVSWADYGFSEVIMRVKKYDLGELMNNRIVVEAAQDIFALSDTVFAAPSTSSWTETVQDPTDVLVDAVVEMPYFFGSRLDAPILDGQADVIPFPAQPQTGSFGFDFYSGLTTGNLDYQDLVEIAYPATGTLVAEYDKSAGFAAGFDATGFALENVLGTFPTGATEAQIQAGEAGLIYVDGEWMGYTTSTVSGNTTLSNVYRGLMGTQIKTHALGTRVYEFKLDLLSDGTFGIDLSEQSTVYYKFLDRAGAQVQDEADVSESSQALDVVGIHDRPLRPRYLTLDSSRAPSEVTGPDGDLDLAWYTSNRAASQITLEDDATETADEAETYDVDVYIGGVLNATLSSTGETSPYTVPFTSVTLSETDCEFQVVSRRTGGNTRESDAYAWLAFAIAQVAISVTYIGTAARTESASATSINVTYPASITEGDLLLCFLMVRATAVAPAGWTQVATSTSTTAQEAVIFAKRADGTETGTLAFTTSGSANRMIGKMANLRGGADYGVPWITQGDEGDLQTSGSPNSGTMTPDWDNTIAFSILTINQTQSPPSHVVVNVEAGYTQISTASQTANRLNIAYREVDDPYSDTVDWTENISGTIDYVYLNANVTDAYDVVLYDIFNTATGGTVARFEEAFTFENDAGDDPAEDTDGVRYLTNALQNGNDWTQTSASAAPAYDLTGRFATFDGTDDTLLCADTPHATTGTFAARFRADAAGTASEQVIIGSQTAGGLDGFISIVAGVASAGIGNVASSTLTDTGATDLRHATTWYTVAVTYDGATCRLYLDGVEVDTATFSGNCSSEAINLGSRQVGGGADDAFFDGEIGAGMMIDRTLTAAEVLELHNYWEFLYP